MIRGNGFGQDTLVKPSNPARRPDGLKSLHNDAPRLVICLLRHAVKNVYMYLCVTRDVHTCVVLSGYIISMGALSLIWAIEFVLTTC